MYRILTSVLSKLVLEKRCLDQIHDILILKPTPFLNNYEQVEVFLTKKLFSYSSTEKKHTGCGISHLQNEFPFFGAIIFDFDFMLFFTV